MSHTVAASVTTTKAVHAGLNVAIGSLTTSMDMSGSQSIAIMSLPAGAEVVDMKMFMAGWPQSTTAIPSLAVRSTLADIGPYLATATASGTSRSLWESNARFQAWGVRHTASSNVMINISPGSNDVTTVASATVKIVCSYLAEQRGD